MDSRSRSFIALIDELSRMRGRSQSAFADVQALIRLSDLENVVLAAVVGAAEPPTVPRIGRSLGHPRQMIQRASDALVMRGLLVWRDNPEHKRARLLVPTDAGRELKRVADARGLATAEAITRGLDAAVIERTVHGLREIREAVERNLRDRPTEEEEAA